MTKLNANQMAGVNACHKTPLLVLAPAGSGKTTLSVFRIARIASLGIQPERIMAVTFTNKAAKELSTRLQKEDAKLKGVLTGTFHSCAIRIMKRLRVELPDCALNSASYSIMDADDQTKVIKALMKILPPPTGLFKDERSLPKTIAGWINDRKEQGQRHKNVLVEPHNPMQAYFRSIYYEYEMLTARESMWDFAEILLRLTEELKQSPRTRCVVSGWFDHILVDEYQDSSELNEEMIRLILPDHCPISAVGDDDQSIYGWRGARNSFILDFPKRYAGAQVVTLNMNYRSTGAIIDAANQLISLNTERHVKVMATNQGTGEKIRVLSHYNTWEEADFIADEIAEAIHNNKAKPEDYGLMFRTNALSLALETKLAERAIPYIMAKGLGFYDREEIKSTIAYLRILNNPMDSSAFERVCGYPKRGIGEKKIASLRYKSASEGTTYIEALQEDKSKGCKELHAVLASMTEKLNHPLDTLIEAVIKESGLMTYFEKFKDPTQAERKVDNLNVFMEIAERNPHVDLDEFLENVALTSEGSKKGEDGRSVTLSTIHGAKGLEYTHCYITGFNEGIFPHAQSTTSLTDSEEERRLAYVAITRAKSTLTISNFKMDRQGNSYQPSSFIGEAGIVIPTQAGPSNRSFSGW